MSKVTFLTILSATLVLINIALIGFFLLKPQHGNKKNEPKAYILKHLNLDKKQAVQYDGLIEVHQKERNALNQEIMELRRKLYPIVLKEGDLSKKDQILVQLKSVHEKLELLHLEHFEQVKEICRPDQRKQFDALVDELTHLFARKRQKKKH
jgi:protein CpxP